MSAVIELRKTGKEELNSIQKTFFRLRKQIEKLQKEVEQTYKNFDDCLEFYHAEIRPKKEKYSVVIDEIIQVLFGHYQHPTLLSKNEKGNLKGLILMQIDRLSSLISHVEVSVEVRDIYEQLKGVSFNEMISGALSGLKAEVADMFVDAGVNVDMPEFAPTDDEFEIFRKIAFAAKDAKSKMENESEEMPKSKKEVEREAKAKKLEDIQKQGIGTIYKQLVKVFHPDKEQDPNLKAQKEEIMKKLTVAYENKDLHTMLLLEMECIGQLEGYSQRKNDEQLKTYNSILKEQIEDLKNEIHLANTHPKYFSIQGYREKNLGIFMVNSDELLEKIEFYQSELKKLKADKPKKIIQTILKEVFD